MIIQLKGVEDTMLRVNVHDDQYCCKIEVDEIFAAKES